MFLRDQPEPSRYGRRSTPPIVACQMPAMPSLRSFYSQLIRAMEMPVLMRSALSKLETDALRKLRTARPACSSSMKYTTYSLARPEISAQR